MNLAAATLYITPALALAINDSAADAISRQLCQLPTVTLTEPQIRS